MKDFIHNWKGEQISAISQGKKWYVALPNVISKSIDKAIKKTKERLDLKMDLGFEYSVSNTWYGCH